MALKINRTVTRITRIVGWGLIILILAAFAKVYIWERSYYKRESITPRSDAVAVITKLPKLQNVSVSKLTEEDYTNHQSEARNPRYLKIDRLNLDVIVTRGNVSNDGQLQYPSNIYELSWYSGSSTPGNDGVVLISGISKYSSEDGILNNLDSLEEGDKITVETGDSSTYTYVVKTTSICSNKEAETVLPKAEQRIEGEETLSLIATNDGNSSFVVVKAVLESQNK